VFWCHFGAKWDIEQPELKIMRCKALNKLGVPCGAPAANLGKFCVMHSGRAAELGSKGGRRRAIFNPDKLKLFPAPKTAGDVRDLLAQSMVELRAGQLDPRIASSICCLAAEFLKTLEMCTIEDVIEPLEQECAQTRGMRHATDGNKENAQTEN
jgi:hypothetical protein